VPGDFRPIDDRLRQFVAFVEPGVFIEVFCPKAVKRELLLPFSLGREDSKALAT
jgi:hypothetical protein